MNRPNQRDEQLRLRLEARREVDPVSACWNYQGCITGNGYGHMSFYGRVEYSHRVAAVLYLGHDLRSPRVVMHECDNPRCFNPEHLTVGTQKENMRRAADKGRMGGKKLTPTAAGEIKWLLARGATQRELATRYGVSTTAIGHIYRKQTWREVEAVPPK